MRFQEVEKLTFREIFFSIFFHYLIDTFSLIFVFFRSSIKIIISGSYNLVTVRDTTCKTYGIQCISTFWCRRCTFRYNIIHFGQAYQRNCISTGISISAIQRFLVIFSTKNICLTCPINNFKHFRIFSPVGIPCIGCFIEEFEFISIQIETLLSIGILHIHIVTNKQVGEFIHCYSKYLLCIAYGIVIGSSLRLVQCKILRGSNYLFSILRGQSFAFRIPFVTIYTGQHSFNRI